MDQTFGHRELLSDNGLFDPILVHERLDQITSRNVALTAASIIIFKQPPKKNESLAKEKLS